MRLRTYGLTALCALCIMLGCGGSSEQGNSRVIGRIASPEESGPIRVCLVPENFNPWTDDISLVYETTLDNSGNYVFDTVAPGNYYLNVFDSSTGAGILRGPYSIGAQEESLGPDSLGGEVSYLSMTLGDAASDSVYGLYIKGTTGVIRVAQGVSQLDMVPVPSGELDVKAVIKSAGTAGFTYDSFCNDVGVLPGEQVGITYRNRAPIVTTPVKELTSWYAFGIVYRDTITAIDPEGGPVVYSVVESPGAYFTIDRLTGRIEWVPESTGYGGSEFIIVIAVIDTQGASSRFSWKVSYATRTAAPAAPAGGASRCVPDTIYEYRSAAVSCSTGAARYRFAWGDGDTSEWSAVAVQHHFWRAAGSFGVRVQVYCSEDQAPSEWSEALSVRVTGVASAPVNMHLAAPPEITVSDTLRISVGRYGCAGALYRYYLDSTGISPWIADTSFAYVPTAAGNHQLSVAVMCDSAVGGSVRTSVPVAVRFVQVYPSCSFIVSVTIREVSAFNYEVSVKIPPAACPGFGTECFYRYVISSLVPGKTFTDTSAWAYSFDLGTNLIVTHPDTIARFGITAQMQCRQDTGYVESAWSPVDTVVPTK